MRSRARSQQGSTTLRPWCASDHGRNERGKECGQVSKASWPLLEKSKRAILRHEDLGNLETPTLPSPPAERREQGNVGNKETCLFFFFFLEMCLFSELLTQSR